MSAPASRRTLLCGIAALPALGGASAEAVSPTLADLVQRHGRIALATDALPDGSSPDDRLCRIASRLRCRIASFSALTVADVMLKVRALREGEGDVESCAEDLMMRLADGRAYLDDLSDSIALDLMRMTA